MQENMDFCPDPLNSFNTPLLHIQSLNMQTLSLNCKLSFLWNNEEHRKGEITFPFFSI